MYTVNVNLKIDYFYLNLRNVVNISPTKTYNTPTKSFFHACSVDTFWSSWTSIVTEIQQVKDVRIIMGQTLFWILGCMIGILSKNCVIFNRKSEAKGLILAEILSFELFLDRSKQAWIMYSTLLFRILNRTIRYLFPKI